MKYCKRNIVFIFVIIFGMRAILGAEIIPDYIFRGKWVPSSNFNNESPILEGGTYFQAFIYDGMKEKVKDATLVLDLPEDTPLLRFYDTRATKFKTNSLLKSKKSITREGKKYLRYEISIPQVCIDKYLGINYWWRTYIWVKTDHLKAGYKALFYWRLESGNAQTRERIIKFSVLKPYILEKLPKTFTLYTDKIHFLNEKTSENEMDVYLRSLCNAGFSGGMFGGYPELFAAAKKLNMSIHVRKALWGFHVCGGQQKESIMAIDPEGQIIKGYWSPEYCIRNGEMYKKYLLDPYLNYAASGKYNILHVDFEPFRLGGHRGSFDALSLKQFTKETGIDVTGMSGKDIFKKYKKEWLAFRCRQNARWVEAWYNALKKANPEVKVLMCSAALAGNPGSRAYERTNVEFKSCDPIQWDNNIDIQGPMIYTRGARYFEDILRNVKYLKKPLIPYSYIGYTWNYNDIIPSLMALFAIGAKGAIYYPEGDILDGRVINESARAMDIIAKNEDFVSQGILCDDYTLTGMPTKTIIVESEGKDKKLMSPDFLRHTKSIAYELHGEKMIAVFNYHKEWDLYFRLALNKLEGNSFYLTQEIARKQIAPSLKREYWNADEINKGIICKVAPDTVEIFTLRKKKPSYINTVITAAELQTEYNHLKTIKKITLTKNNKTDFTISVKNSYIVLENTGQRICIDIEKGIITQWLLKQQGHEAVLPKDKGGAGLAVDRFWYPNELRNLGDQVSGYELVSADSTNEEATIVLSKQFESPGINGLCLTKTFLIKSHNDSITVKSQFANKSSHIIDFSYWVHNIPAFPRGSLEKTLNVLIPTQNGQIKLQGKDPRNVVAAGGAYANAAYSKEFKQCLIGQLSEPWLSIEQKNYAFNVKWKHLNKLMQSYVWRSSDIFTLEWMYGVKKLSPKEEICYVYTLTPVDIRRTPGRVKPVNTEKPYNK